MGVQGDDRLAKNIPVGLFRLPNSLHTYIFHTQLASFEAGMSIANGPRTFALELTKEGDSLLKYTALV